VRYGVRCAMWGYVRAAYVCAMRFIFRHFDRHKKTNLVARVTRLVFTRCTCLPHSTRTPSLPQPSSGEVSCLGLDGAGSRKFVTTSFTFEAILPFWWSEGGGKLSEVRHPITPIIFRLYPKTRRVLVTTRSGHNHRSSVRHPPAST